MIYNPFNIHVLEYLHVIQYIIGVLLYFIRNVHENELHDSILLVHINHFPVQNMQCRHYCML